MKSYWFSIVLPVAIQILAVSMATILPPIFSGEMTLTGTLDGILLMAMIFWPATWALVFLSFPFAYIQMGCARTMARNNTGRLIQFFVGLLNFAIAIQLGAIVLTMWAFKDWRP